MKKRLLGLFLMLVLAGTTTVADTVKASYYHEKFAGRTTANGQRYDPKKLTTAHRTLPFGTKLKLTYRKTGRSCIVVVNDRGPWRKNRDLDLSMAAAKRLGIVSVGVARIEMEIVE